MRFLGFVHHELKTRYPTRPTTNSAPQGRRTGAHVPSGGLHFLIVPRRVFGGTLPCFLWGEDRARPTHQPPSLKKYSLGTKSTTVSPHHFLLLQLPGSPPATARESASTASIKPSCNGQGVGVRRASRRWLRGSCVIIFVKSSRRPTYLSSSVLFSSLLFLSHNPDGWGFP